MNLTIAVYQNRERLGLPVDHARRSGRIRAAARARAPSSCSASSWMTCAPSSASCPCASWRTSSCHAASAWSACGWSWTSSACAPTSRCRRLAGLFPLILEPRWRTRTEPLTIAYHPARQDEWFPVDPGVGLEDQAKAFFTRTWAGLDSREHRRRCAPPARTASRRSRSSLGPSRCSTSSARRRGPGTTSSWRTGSARRRRSRRAGSRC